MHLWRMALAFLVPALAACVVSHSDGNPPPPTNLPPMTVVVDTNQTMNVQGGQGVGVFVEYSAGGHWHVYWACDTTLSGLPCDYQITMSGKAITNATPNQFEPSTDTLSTTTPDVLVATTHVTTGLDGVTFDAAPGADMKVDFEMGGIRDGRFFFFVQNGQPNGNFQGVLTDPLIFEPASP